MIEGKEFLGFKPCPDKKNCVISHKYPGTEKFYEEPIKMIEDKEMAQAKLLGIITKTGGTVVEKSPNYIRAEFKSSVFKFVDDVEFFIADKENLIHFRSASRSGYYDFGVNKKRIGDITFKYHQNDYK
ncbi:MAG: DUF1499 domain-containing protein [Deltaproteobacteria bacterium]|nr:MAG: DUF1499 domain-containing protein [Deltaproteobacteria bacterium]